MQILVRVYWIVIIVIYSIIMSHHNNYLLYYFVSTFNCEISSKPLNEEDILDSGYLQNVPMGFIATYTTGRMQTSLIPCLE